jgi:hypothetical protein
MAHLDDKVAEFYYGELPASEMAGARRHVAECAECRGHVEKFERTHLAVSQSADFDPPRHVIFAPREQRSWWSVLDWRVLAPLSTAVAALVIAVLVAISMAPDREWMANELAKRDREILQLQGQLAYYESYQRAVLTKTYENSSSIQLLAQRTQSQD